MGNGGDKMKTQSRSFLPMAPQAYITLFFFSAQNEVVGSSETEFGLDYEI